MQEALVLARRGWGQVSPNPLVGAVVAHGDTAIGKGWHSKFGADHAEVIALKEAGSQAKGATLYVTLEPCRHEGKTPPCIEAILKAGVRRVVMACRDPSSEAGGGAEFLLERGVQVEVGLEAPEARRLNAGFLWFHLTGVPFASLKLAISLDAKLGAPNTRTSVTGSRALEEVHRLRASHDAIVVGRNTVETDDPLLTARGETSPKRPPARIILDTEFQMKVDTQLVRTIEQAPVWVIGADDLSGREGPVEKLRAVGIRVLEVPRDQDGLLSMDHIWKELASRQIRSILIEGGGKVASSVLRAGVVQRIYAFIAPVFFGEDGVLAFPDVSPSKMEEWLSVERDSLGPDTQIVLDHRSLYKALVQV
jgi:diaminohydroxyphosphoribosylaminopyrimidine deaminase/5-amino-6-(5-phosphoribosylamino)uracil reductase